MPMTRDELLRMITDILSNVVDDPDLELNEDTASDEVPDWDSVNHVKLILQLESDLGIRFASNEINSVSNVRMLIDLLETKL